MSQRIITHLFIAEQVASFLLRQGRVPPVFV
jgi:hypothetical protein